MGRPSYGVGKICFASMWVAGFQDVGWLDRDVSIQRFDHFGGTMKVPYASLNNSIGVSSFQ